MRRHDKAKHIRKANILLEERTRLLKESLPLKKVSGQDRGPAPKKNIPLKKVSGQDQYYPDDHKFSEFDPKTAEAPSGSLEMESDVNEYGGFGGGDDYEMQGQEDFYDNLNNSEKEAEQSKSFMGARIANNGNDSDAIAVSGLGPSNKPGSTVWFEHPYDCNGEVIKEDGHFLWIKDATDGYVVKIPIDYVNRGKWVENKSKYLKHLRR